MSRPGLTVFYNSRHPRDPSSRSNAAPIKSGGEVDHDRARDPLDQGRLEAELEKIRAAEKRLRHWRTEARAGKDLEMFILGLALRAADGVEARHGEKEYPVGAAGNQGGVEMFKELMTIPHVVFGVFGIIAAVWVAVEAANSSEGNRIHGSKRTYILHADSSEYYASGGCVPEREC